MKIENHYEWDKQCLQQPSDMFEEISKTLQRGGFHPEALTSSYLVMYALESQDVEALQLIDLNETFRKMNSLLATLKTMWLWLCFNWRYYKKPIPMIGEHQRLLHEVWLDMVRKQCFPPYRKKRCKRVPLFFHEPGTSCSFCNGVAVIPDHYHGLEFLFIHAWAVVSSVDWERLIALAMTQPFTIHVLPHIALRHQFDVFKMLIEDHYNSFDD